MQRSQPGFSASPPNKFHVVLQIFQTTIMLISESTQPLHIPYFQIKTMKCRLIRCYSIFFFQHLTHFQSETSNHVCVNLGIILLDAQPPVFFARRQYNALHCLMGQDHAIWPNELLQTVFLKTFHTFWPRRFKAVVGKYWPAGQIQPFNKNIWPITEVFPFNHYIISSTGPDHAK